MTMKRWKNIALGVAFTIPVISVYIVKKLQAKAKKRSGEDFPEVTRIRIPLSSLIGIPSTDENSEHTAHTRIVLPEPVVTDIVDGDESFDDTVEPIKYIVSTETQKFHRPECRWVENIREENKLVKTSRAELLENGFTPCGSCKP